MFFKMAVKVCVAASLSVAVMPRIAADEIVVSQANGEVVDNHTRSFTFSKKYLNFPIKNEAEQRLVSVLMDGEVVREFEIGLASGEPDFWVFLEIDAFKGKQATLRIDRYSPAKGAGFDAAYQADTFPGEAQLYKEALRPQIHFNSRRGWNNDPNGMVYYKGEYHLFYQHNPFGWAWGNMTWGHAVSTDLVHWEELGDALHPDNQGTMFSGSAVVDWKNTTGFQTGDEPPLIAIYTSAGGTNPWSEGVPFTQGIAYSNDRGRTWTKYEGNPVLEHVNGGNRDPKVIWYEPLGKWAIALYLDDERMAFYTSDDLKTWNFESEVGGFHECPELFELPIDGDESNKKWVHYGAAGAYYLGDFDGKKFTKETEEIRFHYGNCFYASQTFSDIPEDDGRRIQMAWGQVDLPGMPFNQMMDFPVELTLHTTDEGVRMFAYPVDEIEILHSKKYNMSDTTVSPGKNLLAAVPGELFDIDAEIAVGEASEVGFTIHGVSVTYNVEDEMLVCGEERAPLKAEDGVIELRILVDRVSLEIFGNGGRVYMPMGALPDEDTEQGLEVFASGGDARANRLEIYELESIWQ